MVRKSILALVLVILVSGSTGCVVDVLSPVYGENTLEIHVVNRNGGPVVGLSATIDGSPDWWSTDWSGVVILPVPYGERKVGVTLRDANGVVWHRTFSVYAGNNVKTWRL